MQLDPPSAAQNGRGGGAGGSGETASTALCLEAKSTFDSLARHKSSKGKPERARGALYRPRCVPARSALSCVAEGSIATSIERESTHWISPCESHIGRMHNAPKTGLDAPCEFRNSRARAPPSVAPPSSTSGAWGGFGVLLYIGFLGPRRWILVLRDLQRRNTILS